MERHVLIAHTFVLVGNAHFDLVKLVEHVEFREGDLAERVESHCLARHDNVEPANATTTPGVRAEFVTSRNEVLRSVSVELGRKGPRTDASDVGLGDPDDGGDVTRTEPRTNTRATRDRVRGRNEGVRPVIEIEESRLGPF